MARNITNMNNNIHAIGTAAQPPLTANAVADFGEAIRNAHTALNGPLDAIAHRPPEPRSRRICAANRNGGRQP
jgi:hypothetical protein